MTNVITYVLKLIDKHFTQNKAKCGTLAKAFNRNNVVCTYRTGRNMGAYISSHNKAILSKNEEEVTEDCNCRGGPTNCPLQGECQAKNVIYGAEVTAVDSQSGAVVKVDGLKQEITRVKHSILSRGGTNTRRPSTTPKRSSRVHKALNDRFQTKLQKKKGNLSLQDISGS